MRPVRWVRFGIHLGGAFVAAAAGALVETAGALVETAGALVETAGALVETAGAFVEATTATVIGVSKMTASARKWLLPTGACRHLPGWRPPFPVISFAA